MNIGKTTSHEYEYRYVRRRQPEPPRKSAHVEVDEAFRAFFARRGMEPPKVSSHVVEPSSLQED